MASPLDDALRAWRQLLGADRVVAAGPELTAAQRATFAWGARVSAILSPTTRDEVRACLRAATEWGVAVHVCSRGKNWGLGSRLPVRGESVLIDLSGMKRILDFDEELARVTVEPGVSFAQLYEYLSARGSRLFANTTGATPDASVLGNALERGDGTGPNGDRFAHVCGLEAVLADGSVVNTGFDRFAGARTAGLHRWGVGPSLDGLFSQSNLGVVTRMTLWLTPLPRALTAVRFSFADPARLPAVVDALRELRLEGTVRSVAGIWNDYRVLSTTGQYPRALTGGETPLAREIVDDLASDWGGARWFGLTAIYAATPLIARAARLRIDEVLRPLVDQLSFEERSGEPRSGAELFDDAGPWFRFLQGIPHTGSVRSVYWRKRSPPPDDPDPDRDRCGALWLCPAVPFRGADVAEAVQLCERVIPEHGLEPLIAMVAQSERVVYLVPLLIWDRDDANDDRRALECHDRLLSELMDRGFLPYRLGVQSMSALPAAHDDSARVLRRLKRALDPADVLAPGRYDWRDGDEN